MSSFDFDLALTRANEDVVLLKELAALCARECEIRLPELKIAFDAGDPQAIERQATSLAETFGVLGAGDAAGIAREVADSARAGDLKGSAAAFAALSVAIEELIEEFSVIEVFSFARSMGDAQASGEGIS